MPGLLRARRRLRPRQRADPRRRSTATSGWSTARRCGRRSPTWPTGASSLRRTEPVDAAAHGPVVPPGADATSPASRSGRSSRSPAPRSSTRCSSTAPRTAADHVVGDVERRAGGSRWARSGSSAASPPSASSSASSASWSASSTRAERTGADDDPQMRRPARRRVDRPADHALNALRTLAATERGPAAEASIAKLYWAHLAPRLGELAIDVLGPRATVADGRADDLRAAAARSCSPAPTRSTAARTRSSATSSASASSACPARLRPLTLGSAARRQVAGRGETRLRRAPRGLRAGSG